MHPSSDAACSSSPLLPLWSVTLTAESDGTDFIYHFALNKTLHATCTCFCVRQNSIFEIIASKFFFFFAVSPVQPLFLCKYEFSCLNIYFSFRDFRPGKGKFRATVSLCKRPIGCLDRSLQRAAKSVDHSADGGKKRKSKRQRWESRVTRTVIQNKRLSNEQCTFKCAQSVEGLAIKFMNQRVASVCVGCWSETTVPPPPSRRRRYHIPPSSSSSPSFSSPLPTAAHMHAASFIFQFCCLVLLSDIVRLCTITGQATVGKRKKRKKETQSKPH